MLGLSPILVALGLIAGLARGGKVSNICISQFRFPWLVLAGLSVQISGTVLAVVSPQAGRHAYIWFLASSFGLLIGFALFNLNLPGGALIAAGLALNLAVIVLNNGMPVSRQAAETAGLSTSDYLQLGIKHREMRPETTAWFLGDIIPLPVLKKVISPGDVLIGAGMFVLVEGLVRYRPRRRMEERPG